MEKSTKILNSFWISGNTPSSKNAKQWTGKFLVHNPRVLAWIKHTKLEWEYQKERFLDCISDLPFPLYLELTFYRGNKHQFDYHNMAQIVFDIMKEEGWIPDDNANIIKPYFGDYKYDKEKPGVLIIILRDKPKHY